MMMVFNSKGIIISLALLFFVGAILAVGPGKSRLIIIVQFFFLFYNVLNEIKNKKNGKKNPGPVYKGVSSRSCKITTTRLLLYNNIFKRRKQKRENGFILYKEYRITNEFILYGDVFYKRSSYKTVRKKKRSDGFIL